MQCLLYNLCMQIKTEVAVGYLSEKNHTIKCRCNITDCIIDCILTHRPYALYECKINNKIILSNFGETKSTKNTPAILNALNNILSSDVPLEKYLTAIKIKNQITSLSSKQSQS